VVRQSSVAAAVCVQRGSDKAPDVAHVLPLGAWPLLDCANCARTPLISCGESRRWEEITITVAGRPGARLVPASPRTWRRWSDVAELFSGPADTAWETDRDVVAHEIRDPWAKQ
jgi:hypothetical protein